MSIDQAANACVRAYRWVARAFPDQFLRFHGEEVGQLTEEMIRETASQVGWAGFLPFIARLFADLFRTIVNEHLLELRLDLRYVTRTLLQSKMFALAAIVSLGLGISVVTTVYSQFESMVFRTVPAVTEPASLVRFEGAISYPNYEFTRDRSGQFREVAAYLAPVPFMMEDSRTHTERHFGHLVTPNYFQVLGVRPHLGRVLTAEDAASKSAVAVISHRLWQRRFASAPDVAGRTVLINRQPVTIAGVAAPEFLGASPMLATADLFLPVTLQETIAPELGRGALESRRLATFQIAGRLQPGIAAAQAQAALDAQFRQLEQQHNDPGKERKGRRVTIVPGGRLLPVRDEDMGILVALPLVLCALMLWIACANIATVLLARAVHRRKEIAIRLALGASRARIVRQLLTESTLLALGGGAVGVALALWSMRFMDLYRPILPDYLTLEYFQISIPAIAFTLLVSLLTGLLFGLAPALQATRTDVGPALKGAAGGLPRYRWWSTRNMLVLQQVAGSLALLMISGVIALGFQRNTHIDLGYQPAGVWEASVDPRREGYSAEETHAFATRLRDRLVAVPGVLSAGVASITPASVGDGTSSMATGEDFAALSNKTASIKLQTTGPGYLETLQARLKSGRFLADADTRAPLRRLVVNRTLAEQRFAGRDPVGQTLEIQGKKHEIAGLVEDLKSSLVVNLELPIAYALMNDGDYAQPGPDGLIVLVRTQPGLDAGILVRDAARTIDPKLTVFGAGTIQQDLDSQATLARIGSYTYAGIGAFSLLLATVGLAGVTAYAVVARTREIGIRLALGAQRRSVLALVMREGVWLTLTGSAIGVASAFALVRVMGAYMDAVGTVTKTTLRDPILLAGGPALLVGLTLLACYWPARRTTRITPMAALRED